jgi:hypothetical protein
LNYNWNRYYTPPLGRYLTADRIKDINLFIYGANNPLAVIDPDGYFGYRNPKIPPAKDKLLTLLNCIEAKYGATFTVNATTNGHVATSPHGRGEAADIQYNLSNPDKFLCATSLCGAGMAIDEAKHPSANSTGPHIHLQLGPGKDGWTGDLPSPDKCKKKCG